MAVEDVEEDEDVDVVENAAVSINTMPNLDAIITRASSKSSLRKLIRTTALVLRIFMKDLRV